MSSEYDSYWVVFTLVLPPGEWNQCVECPLGGVCNGKTLKGYIKGSVWVQAGIFMRIFECPAGYILVRFNYLIQSMNIKICLH
jgi:hypothetical protein